MRPDLDRLAAETDAVPYVLTEPAVALADLRKRIEMFAAELDRRYTESESNVGCPDGAGYYDLLADDLRELLKGSALWRNW